MSYKMNLIHWHLFCQHAPENEAPPNGVLFSFSGGATPSNRAPQALRSGIRFGLPPQSASSLLVSGKASNFHAPREWRGAFLPHNRHCVRGQHGGDHRADKRFPFSIDVLPEPQKNKNLNRRKSHLLRYILNFRPTQ